MKWFVEEEGTELAVTLLNGSRVLMAPWLLRLEVTGGLLRQYREEKLTEKATRAALAGLDQIIDRSLLQVMPNEDLWETAVGLAFKIKHPPADCLYLALGKAVNAPLVTTDEPLARRASKSGTKAVLLKDYHKLIATM